MKVIDGREPLTTLTEAKTALFTHDSGERKYRPAMFII